MSGSYNRQKKPSKKVQYFDIKLKQWSNAADLNEARCYHASIVLDGVPYVLGGQVRYKEQLGSIQMIKLDTGTAWITIVLMAWISEYQKPLYLR